MGARVLLVTVGTMGDLHPFIAIGLALQRRGLRPIMAVPKDHVAKCLAAGLETEAATPGFDAIARGMGLGDADAVRRLMGSQRLMMDRMLMPALEEGVVTLDRLARRCDAIVGSVFAFAGPLVAEKHGLPLISVVLQPMAMLSALDPPATPEFWMMRHGRAGSFKVRWNRVCYAVLRGILGTIYGRRVDQVRAEHGLPRAGARHLLEGGGRAVLRLGCYSPHLAPLPPDVGRQARVVGFPLFDSASGRDEPLHPLLSAFLSAGEAPLVFTLGTFAVGAAVRFYDRAREAASRLNRRAVLLVGNRGAPRWNGDILVCNYAPHSLLFPSAAAIIHHGGIGTTGQAMRAGRPQLVVPHMGDQHDHAARIVRMGLGLSMSADRITASKLASTLEQLFADPGYADRARAIAGSMAGENGAETAAGAIEDVLARAAR